MESVKLSDNDLERRHAELTQQLINRGGASMHNYLDAWNQFDDIVIIKSNNRLRREIADMEIKLAAKD